MNVLENGIAAAIGGLIVAAIDTVFFCRAFRFTEKVGTLEKERIAKLEAAIAEHCRGEQSQKILEQLESVSRSVGKLTDRVDRSLEINANQEAHLCGLDRYVGNLDKFIQDHIKSHRR